KPCRPGPLSLVTVRAIHLTPGLPGQGLDRLNSVHEHGRDRVHPVGLVQPVSRLEKSVLLLGLKCEEEIERLLQVVGQLQTFPAAVPWPVIMFGGNERDRSQTVSRCEGAGIVTNARVVVANLAIGNVSHKLVFWWLHPGVAAVSNHLVGIPRYSLSQERTEDQGNPVPFPLTTLFVDTGVRTPIVNKLQKEGVRPPRVRRARRLLRNGNDPEPIAVTPPSPHWAKNKQYFLADARSGRNQKVPLKLGVNRFYVFLGQRLLGI